jgi:hypothetical protein
MYMMDEILGLFSGAEKMGFFGLGIGTFVFVCFSL